MKYLRCEEVVTGPEPKYSVIWLHGLGASGNDFVPVVPHLQLPAELSTRFVFPHAPELPVTVNGGMVMPAWYDIYTLDIDRKIDEKQIRTSAGWIHDLVDREVERGIPTERIVLAGFSQGGAVAYEAALSFAKPLAGLLCLSTYFATRETVDFKPIHKTLPVLIGHGTQDPVVPEVLGQRANAALTDIGLNPEYQTYPMQHEVCLEQISDIGAWLTKVLRSAA